VTAYEYVPDSEECRSESTVSSTLEATQHSVSEPESEEVSCYDSEAFVMTADVQWCLLSVDKPNVAGPTQTRVQQQTPRSQILALFLHSYMHLICSYKTIKTQ